MVLGMLSVTLVVSYMLFRSQVAAQQLQENANLPTIAQHGALTAYAAALRKMHQNDWGGADSSYSGTINNTMNSTTTVGNNGNGKENTTTNTTNPTGITQAYSVTYATGDSSLAADDAKQPWRVTVTVKNTAVDLARPTVTATKQVRAVVELIPMALNTAPTTFNNAKNYTVYQYAQAEFQVQYPCRVQGANRLMGNLRLCDAYPNNSTTAANRYMSDLTAMQASYGDLRPLNGPIYLPTSRTSSSILTQLSNNMGVSYSNISTGNANDWPTPSLLTSYQLYPGGKTYQASAISNSVSNATYAPNMTTNPLGVFYNTSAIQLGANVSITGTLVTTNKVQFLTGSRATVQAHSLPPLDGSTTPVQLPAIIATNNVELQSGAKATIRGLVATFANFDVQSGTINTSLDLQGRVITQGFYLRSRTEWINGNTWWSILWALFQNAISNGTAGTPYYPIYVQAAGNNPTPVLTAKPETSSIQYTWLGSNKSVFVPASGDPGLRWKVISIDDNE